MFPKIILLFFLMKNSKESTLSDAHPDTYLSITEFARKYGYPIETHNLTTEDGYILTTFRIPHGKNTSTVNEKPVFLMHGMLGTAMQYLSSARNDGSLAFFLADNNYDVWLGNARGNTYCRQHLTLNSSYPAFWNFSWHEIGVFDVSEQIDYILNITRREKVVYIGGSQGAAVFYVLCSERPEYQEKVAAAALLAPAGYMEHVTCIPLLFGAKNYDRIKDIMEKYNLYAFLNVENRLSEMLTSLCANSQLYRFCINLYKFVLGTISSETDVDMFIHIFHNISNIAVKQLLHVFQGILSGRFRKWDFGSASRNLAVYGQVEPPDYHLENIRVPILMFSSTSDILTNIQDVIAACIVLQNCTNVLMDNRDWSHVDFFYGVNNKQKINIPILQFLNKININ